MFFGPLMQFDLLEKNPSCAYDFLTIIFGQTEFDFIMILIFFFIICWQIYTYYNETTQGDSPVYFDEETIIVDIISRKNFNYNDLIVGLFSLIFVCNLFGLFPYSQTITAQLIFTLTLALITILTIWFHSFYNNKIAILNHFLPNGSPLVIIPFIILIEIISNISRIISLSVRLFANITSGHALLKILASFGLIALSFGAIWKVLCVFPIIVIFIITILELLIAFLQTYVFITLTLIYISETE